MRRGVRMGGMVLACWLGLCLPVRAGVYNTHEPFFLPSSPADIQRWIFDLREVAIEGDPRLRQERPAIAGSLRDWYRQEARSLEARGREGSLDTIDRVNLSACYLRTRRFDEAIGILKHADPKQFLVLANLASAYEGIGELNLARLHQQQALRAWPALFPGWPLARLQWYRRAERFHLKLLDLRLEEQRLTGGQAKWQKVDALFGPQVRFVGPSGEYEAGAINQEALDQLPPDALNLLLQLVQWQPFDDRLYWLLAEVLNALGHVDVALERMDELVQARQHSDVRELFQHRKVLREASPAAVLAAWRDPNVRLAILCLMSPRGLPVPVGAGVIAQQAGDLALGFLSSPAPSSPDAALAPEQPAASWMPRWRDFGVGFAFGGLLALLGAFQWQEWRRRQSRAAWPPPVESAHSVSEAPASTGTTRTDH